MSVKKTPLQCALLVAAFVQLIPADAYAAKADKDDDDAKACEDCPDYSGRSGWVEGGIAVQSNDSYNFGRYTGQQDSGANLNLDGYYSYRGKLNGGFVEGNVENLGLDSRRVSVESGRQGKYEVDVEYDQIPNYRKDLTNTSLETERDRFGVRFSAVAAKNWDVSGHYRHEDKEGTRDTGSTFGFSTPQILAVPVDYQTDDFGVALGYQGERLQARFAYDGSLFKNGIDAINWPNPGAGPANGQIAEAPDNQFHQLSAQMGYQLSDHTHVGASFARGRMSQDQTFLGFNATTAATGSNLNGEVDTTMAKVDLNSRPSSRLRLDASYTYSNRDNNTPVNSYAYLLADTAFSPATRTNRPYSFEQNLLRLKAGYRVAKDVDLSGGIDYDKMDRTYQQAEQTEDKTIWAKVKFQPADELDTAIKISHAKRDASTYDPTAFQNPLNPESGATPGEPVMKAFEMADRTRDKVGFDVSYNAKENLSLGLNVDYYKDDYKNMALGLNNASGTTATPNLTYSFSEKLSASAYYTWEKLKSKQTGSEWITAVVPVPPTWIEADTNTTHTVGLSFNWKAIPKKLDLGADVAYSDFTGKMQYPGSTDLPELSSRLTALGVHGVYKIKDNMTVRAAYRYEKYREYDWANAPVVLANVLNTLGVPPQTQETHLVYVALRYEFK